tara:strand:- start:154 stop:345 length:192 start_codon:yes stop_codon:yes gene_type:complete
MAVFRCNISGNTMEVHTALDIEAMEVHPGYTLVEEDLRSPVPQVMEEDVVVETKKTKKSKKEL